MIELWGFTPERARYVTGAYVKLQGTDTESDAYWEAVRRLNAMGAPYVETYIDGEWDSVQVIIYPPESDTVPPVPKAMEPVA